MHASILAMKQSGGAVLMTTHDMDEAERLCDRIAILHLGRVVAEGSPADLTARSRAATTVYLLHNKLKLKLRSPRRKRGRRRRGFRRGDRGYAADLRHQPPSPYTGVPAREQHSRTLRRLAAQSAAAWK